MRSFLICIFIFLLFSSPSLDSSCIIQVADREVGVREATGHNDGLRVGEYQKTTGNRKGDSWCASFVKWVYLQCGVSLPINGAAKSCFNKDGLVYYQTRFIQEPKPGDIFTIYSSSERRICHTGLYRGYYNSRIYTTIEGNTNDNGSSNGIGVFKRLRSYKATYAISRFK